MEKSPAQQEPVSNKLAAETVRQQDRCHIQIISHTDYIFFFLFGTYLQIQLNLIVLLFS